MGIKLSFMNKIRVFCAFSGYDSQCLALRRLDIPFELVDWSEIDKYAIQAHDVLFPEAKDRNYGDISKIDWAQVPDFDLFTYSFPCTDISNAGQQKGLEKGSGTRSSLLWECEKAIRAKKPKYLLMENVSALVSQKFLPYYEEWRRLLVSLGYESWSKVLNATDYGVPQNRERIFMVSILGGGIFYFPEPMPLNRCLGDVLEDEVDEKYFLSEKLTKTVLSDGKNGFPGGTGVRTENDDTAPTINATCYKIQRSNCFIKYPSDKTICLNSKVDGKQPSLTDRVYSAAAATAVTTGFHPAVLIPKRNDYGKAVRKDYENGNIREKRRNMTDLVPREDGLSNTITTVQKDNILIVPNVIQVGNLIPDRDNRFSNPQRGRIYSQRGVSPTLSTMAGGNLEPKIIIGSTQKNAYKGSVKEPSPTITAACGMGGGQTPMVLMVAENLQRMAEKSRGEEIGITIDADGNLRPHRMDKAKSGVSEYQTEKDTSVASMLISARPNNVYGESTDYRIRKLTPRECLRLMDVDDSDIDKLMAAGISNTQLYKMAGNSIVVNVLYHIFRKMFVNKENENIQLTLF